MIQAISARPFALAGATALLAGCGGTTLAPGAGALGPDAMAAETAAALAQFDADIFAVQGMAATAQLPSSGSASYTGQTALDLHSVVAETASLQALADVYMFVDFDPAADVSVHSVVDEFRVVSTEGDYYFIDGTLVNDPALSALTQGSAAEVATTVSGAIETSGGDFEAVMTLDGTFVGSGGEGATGTASGNLTLAGGATVFEIDGTFYVMQP